jgi:hypothetical protein
MYVILEWRRNHRQIGVPRALLKRLILNACESWAQPSQVSCPSFGSNTLPEEGILPEGAATLWVDRAQRTGWVRSMSGLYSMPGWVLSIWILPPVRELIAKQACS